VVLLFGARRLSPAGQQADAGAAAPWVGYMLRSPRRRPTIMGETQLTLRWPREDEEAEFLRAHRATSPDTPSFLHYHEEGMPFRRYLEVLAEQEQGIGLPSARHVASTFVFAFVGARIVGRASIRHSLNAMLERMGGHIGYVVVPAFRRQGHATSILRLALQIAHERLGIRRVLVTCDDDNVGSMRTIEKNGGVLENIVSGPDLSKPKRRYWIERP
jgi:predicted acetyltransferase